MSILVTDKINMIKRINKLFVTFHVSCNKKHEFSKKFCPGGGKECRLWKIKNPFEGSLVCKERKKQIASNKNNSTNFTEKNDCISDESLFTVTHYVNQVKKPGHPTVLLNLSDQKDISNKVNRFYH